MFGFGNSQPQQQMPSTMLNLSQTGAPTGMISQQSMGMGGQQPGQTFMGGMFAGAGYGDQYNQYYNQPVAPPSELQTLSVENVMAQLSTMQNSSNQAIQNAEMQRQQVLAMANQSMMAGALNAAMANPNLIENVGTGIGSFTRNLLTGGR